MKEKVLLDYSVYFDLLNIHSSGYQLNRSNHHDESQSRLIVRVYDRTRRVRCVNSVHQNSRHRRESEIATKRPRTGSALTHKPCDIPARKTYTRGSHIELRNECRVWHLEPSQVCISDWAGQSRRSFRRSLNKFEFFYDFNLFISNFNEQKSIKKSYYIAEFWFLLRLDINPNN